jgi:hypothetical protein
MYRSDNASDYPYYPDKDDILADDWEIEEKKVEITRLMLESALRSIHVKLTDFDVLCKELGL